MTEMTAALMESGSTTVLVEKTSIEIVLLRPLVRLPLNPSILDHHYATLAVREIRITNTLQCIDFAAGEGVQAVESLHFDLDGVSLQLSYAAQTCVVVPDTQIQLQV